MEENGCYDDDDDIYVIYNLFILQMRKYAGKVVYSAMESYGKKFGVRLENEAGTGNLFKAVKRIVRQGKDVVGNSSTKNIRKELVTDESEIREIWSSYFEKLLNEEFEWKRDFLNDWQEDDSSTADSGELITEQEVKVEKQSHRFIGGYSLTVASSWRSGNKMGDRDL